MQRKFLLFLCVGIFSSHCVSKDSTPSEDKDIGPKCTIQDSSQGARLEITKQWLGRFLDTMCLEDGVRDGWLLFDQGGLGGGGEYGQAMALSGKTCERGDKECKMEFRIFFVPVSGKKIVMTENKLSEERKNTFLAEVRPRKTDDKKFLDHWPDGFDMFEREFVHVEKEGSTLKISQRVKWRFGRGPCERHCKIEQAFQAILK